LSITIVEANLVGAMDSNFNELKIDSLIE